MRPSRPRLPHGIRRACPGNSSARTAPRFAGGCRIWIIPPIDGLQQLGEVALPSLGGRPVASTRTTHCRTSGENRLEVSFAMVPPSQGLEPLANLERFSGFRCNQFPHNSGYGLRTVIGSCHTLAARLQLAVATAPPQVTFPLRCDAKRQLSGQ